MNERLVVRHQRARRDRRPRGLQEDYHAMRGATSIVSRLQRGVAKTFGVLNNTWTELNLNSNAGNWPTECATPIGTNAMDVTTLDATGLLCPLPVLKARKALKPLSPGAVLEIRATDQGAVKDFAAFCRTTGNELISSREEDGVFVFAIRKTAA